MQASVEVGESWGCHCGPHELCLKFPSNQQAPCLQKWIRLLFPFSNRGRKWNVTELRDLLKYFSSVLPEHMEVLKSHNLDADIVGDLDAFLSILKTSCLSKPQTLRAVKTLFVQGRFLAEAVAMGALIQLDPDSEQEGGFKDKDLNELIDKVIELHPGNPLASYLRILMLRGDEAQDRRKWNAIGPEAIGDFTAACCACVAAAVVEYLRICDALPEETVEVKGRPVAAAAGVRASHNIAVSHESAGGPESEGSVYEEVEADYADEFDSDSESKDGLGEEETEVEEVIMIKPKNAAGSSNSTASSSRAGRKSVVVPRFSSSAASSVVASPAKGSGRAVSRPTNYAKQPLTLSAGAASKNPNDLLLELCVGENTPERREILEALRRGADPNSASSTSGMTALLYATAQGHTSTMKILLDGGGDGNVADSARSRADPNLADKKGRTPLWVAAQRGQRRDVKVLLDAGALVDKADENGSSPLRVACFKGNKDAAILLLEAGADLNKPDKNGCGPMHVACARGHKDIVYDILASYPHADLNKIDANGRSPLYIACSEGNEEVLKLLLMKTPSLKQVDKNGCSPLHVACSKGYGGIVKMLLLHNAVVDQADKNGSTALHMACGGGYEGIVDLLLKKDASVNKMGKNDATPLLIACEKGHVVVVEQLLKKDALVNQVDKNGYSPMHYACAGGNEKMVKLLLDKQANVNTATKDFELTPLHMAAQKARVGIIKLLLAKGAPVDPKDKNGRTPLWDALRPADASTALIADPNRVAAAREFLKKEAHITLIKDAELRVFCAGLDV